MTDIFIFNNTEVIILSILGITLLTQIIYYSTLYNRIHRHNLSANKGKIAFSTEYPPLSVIICAKDASKELEENLPSILEQDYPEFEVIVVNNNSSDESEDLLTLMENKYPHLYHTFTPDSARYISHKKLALTVGIKASKYDWLVMTETNCKPVSKDWLKLIARNFTNETDIVLGYSGYERGKGWFQRKVSFDNLFHAIRFLGFALIHKPYMGIGRNMAYRKELFFKNKGFSAHLNLQRGDDDLFINRIATSENTHVETDMNACVCMKPIEYKKQWKEEKISYAVTSQYYKGIQRYLLGLETFSRLLFYVSFISLLVLSIQNKSWGITGICTLIYITRYICQAIVINKTTKDFGGSGYWFTLPIFDLLQPLCNARLKIIRRFRRKRNFMRK